MGVSSESSEFLAVNKLLMILCLKKTKACFNETSFVLLSCSFSKLDGRHIFLGSSHSVAQKVVNTNTAMLIIHTPGIPILGPWFFRMALQIPMELCI